MELSSAVSLVCERERQWWATAVSLCTPLAARLSRSRNHRLPAFAARNKVIGHSKNPVSWRGWRLDASARRCFRLRRRARQYVDAPLLGRVTRARANNGLDWGGVYGGTMKHIDRLLVNLRPPASPKTREKHQKCVTRATEHRAKLGFLFRARNAALTGPPSLVLANWRLIQRVRNNWRAGGGRAELAARGKVEKKQGVWGTFRSLSLFDPENSLIGW